MKSNDYDVSITGLEEDLRASRVHRGELRRAEEAKAPVEVALKVNFEEGAAGEVAIRVGVRYTAVRELVARPLLDYFVKVRFKVDGIDADDGSVLIDEPLLSTLLTTAIGALRGMASLRTKGTLLEKYPLPLYSMATLLERMRGPQLKLRRKVD